MGNGAGREFGLNPFFAKIETMPWHLPWLAVSGPHVSRIAHTHKQAYIHAGRHTHKHTYNTIQSSISNREAMYKHGQVDWD